MSDQDGMARPSLFWERIGSTHAEDLKRYGVDACKRHQALRYFTWRWSWGGLLRSEQLRFLLRHTPPRTWLRCALERADLSDLAWEGIPWARRDRWLYTVAVRLVWEFARTQDRVGVLALPEPELGAPLPVRWRGRLISQDLANTALEVATIVRVLDGKIPASIVEIGAGYGRNAYALMRLFPHATYTIIDIEPAISVSRWYLSHLFPGERLRFLTPTQASRLPAASLDLAISVSSLQEMTPQQLDGYLSLLNRVVAGGVVYLKQWKRWHNPDDDVTLEFRKYPIPTGWRELYNHSAAVQPRFQEAAWRVPVFERGLA